MSEKDHWKITQATSKDGRVRVFIKNLAPSKGPADSDYLFLAFVTFRYHELDERGLPKNKEEWAAIKEIEDGAATPLEVGGAAVQVAEVLGEGVKDLLFYVRDLGAFANGVGLLMQQYAHLKPSAQICMDAAWSQYKNFPG